MSLLRVLCPHCSFSRDVPAASLPDQPVQATCPKCGKAFAFDKAEAVRHAGHDPQPAASGPAPEATDRTDSAGVPPLSRTTTRNDAASGTQTAQQGLMPVGELFSSTWQLFKRRWATLLGILVTTVVAAAVPPLLVSAVMGGTARESFSGLVALFMLFGMAMIASFLVICWGMAAAVSAAVDERMGFKQAFRQARSCWIPLIWVSTLYSFIVGGASLLFLIPGFLTGIWFFACIYLVVADGTRGMDALLKSKALVDGRFWAVAGRLLLVWLLGMVLGMIPVIGAVVSLLMAPFSMLYAVLLYRNLQQTAGTLSWSSSDGTKAAWLLLGLAGYVLMPLLLFLLLGAALFSHLEPLFRMLLQQGAAQEVLASGLATLLRHL